MAKKNLGEALIANANKTKTAAKSQGKDPAPNMSIITNPAREIASETVKDAMVMGWDQAIQKHAYENRVAETRIREILDEALEYEDKSDPAGRIEGLEDWRHEKRG